MPETVRPDGARIHYEVRGTGFPVLLIGPGEVPGQCDTERAAFTETADALAGQFQVITVEARHNGRSTGPAEPFCYGRTAADLLSVLDELGIERAHIAASGAGTAQAWRLVQDAPERIGSVVAHAPAGLAEGNTLGDFLATFDEAMRLPRAEGIDGVIEEASLGGGFAARPGAGPYARQLHEVPDFREELLALRRERYIVRVVRFRDGIWPQGSAWFSVPEESMTRFPAPLLVLPGNSPLAPAALAKRLASDVPGARLLDGAADTADRRTETLASVVSFLLETTAR
ncbi:alpha/beta hydrolase [Streptomyces sp. NBC_00555]|uniref:alpha/beta fold hydrolase n=1 Tax=Streptomyces sp. NBC_00555 TaxID=2903662 RepID=UPI0022567F8F|nr:alpha/beta hydrolase [Streptomyces sp. NBC_00555]MCX5016579.1 alpha/beta hydrolase [Streptomyces sp. NBC_00555]